MRSYLLSFFVGLAMGGIFSFFRLPIPAPNNFAGILGIFGVFVGFWIVNRLFGVAG